MELEKCKVLILKNDEDVRDIAKVMLGREGFKDKNIFLAKNVEDAKEIINILRLNNERINLVLTGIGIAEEEGPVLLKWTEKEGIRKKIKVIFYSGGGEHYIRQQAEKHGADAFISLPVFDEKKFIAVIKEMAEK